MKNKDRFEVLLENIDSKYDRLIEYVEIVPTILERLIGVEEKVDKMSIRLPILESVVKDHSGDIAELKTQAHAH